MDGKVPVIRVQLENVERVTPGRFIGPGDAVRVIAGRYEGREGIIYDTLPHFMLQVREGWL